jgi:hypothetical protein
LWKRNSEAAQRATRAKAQGGRLLRLVCVTAAPSFVVGKSKQFVAAQPNLVRHCRAIHDAVMNR